MDEYIKREEAIEAVKHAWAKGLEPSQYLEIISTADVATVRHGRWDDEGEYAVCMECGGRSGIQYDGVEPRPLMTQFCPNCGCRMDGGAD